MTGPQMLTASIRAFEDQRDRVTSLATALSPARFDAAPAREVTETLTGLGHFDAYDCEVAWSPRLVVGHLTDSAGIFAERIARIRAEDAPWLADFVTDEPSRLTRYRATARGDLLADLEAAQDRLVAALRAVRAQDLDRTATHEVDGVLSLRDVVDFLPGHQRDHADQLELLAAHG